MENRERDAGIGRRNKKRDSGVDGDRRPVVLSLASTAAARGGVGRRPSIGLLVLAGKEEGELLVLEERRVAGAGREQEK